MTDFRREPLKAMLDVTFYAPIGAFFHGPQVVSELAERGRGQVANARVIGKLALARGRQEAERMADTAQQRVNDAMVAAARVAGAPMAGADVGADADEGPDAEVGPDQHDGQAGSRSEASVSPGPNLHVVPDAHPPVSDLPIPDYDNLSASQVVPRLDDLADDELQAVRDYEQAHRGRMTILSRIAQLQAS